MAYERKLQELFRTPDNQYDYTTHQLVVKTLPKQPFKTNFGPRYFLILEKDGEAFRWELTDKQLEKMWKLEGSTQYKVSEGDTVEITLNAAAPGSQYPTYTVLPVGGAKPSVAPSKGMAPASPNRNESFGREQKVEWDGTPRQRAFIDGLTTLTAGALAAGQDVTDESTRQFLCDTLLWCREKGRELEATYPNH